MSERPESGDRPKEEEFRKPDGARPGAEPASEGGLPVAPGDAAAREVMRAMQPFKELARAFRENTEAIKGLAEGQERIGRRMERTDRSEAVIRSTKALNETFRGVQRTQERLMGRLEKEKKRPLVLVLLTVLLMAGLVGGTLAVLLGWLDRWESGNRQDRVETIDRVIADKNARIADLAEEIAGREEELARAKARSADLTRRTQALNGEKDRLARENEGLLANKEELSRELRENARLSSDNAERLRQIIALKRQVEDLSAKLELARAELTEKTRRLAELSRSPPERAAPVAGRASPASAARPPGGVPAGAVTDAGEIARIVLHLNRLLAEGRDGSPYRFVKIGGIRGKVLYDVVVASGDAGVEETKRIEAAECRVVLDEAQRRAELRFRNGHLSLYGARTPFWGGRYVVPVVNVDPAAWLESGLTVFDRLF